MSVPFELGNRVRTQDDRTGTVGFYGPVHFAGTSNLVGVALDQPFVGQNNGTVDGWCYFDAPQNSGVFLDADDLQQISEDDSDYEAQPYEQTTAGGDIHMDTLGGHAMGEGHHETGAPYDDSEIGISEDGYRGTGTAGVAKNRRRYDDSEMLQSHALDDDDDKYKRWQRGMTAALEHEVFDYKHDPNDTEVVVNYALKGTSFEKIKKISSKHFRKAIKNALPEEIKIENDKFGKFEFEELTDYTEMKVRYECDSPEEADDLKWSMLDPYHVNKFNGNLKDNDKTDFVNAEYSYLERKTKDGCCKWVKPCIACFCCWLLLLTLLLGLIWGEMMKLADDVDQLETNGVGNGTMAGGGNCKDFDICDQIAQNKNDIDDLKNQEEDNGGKIGDNRKDIDAILAAGGGAGAGPVDTAIQTMVERSPIDATGAAVAKCKSPDMQIIACWVYLPNHWKMYTTYISPNVDVKNGFPDCQCFCQHKDDSYGCQKVGAECRVQCAKFGSD